MKISEKKTLEITIDHDEIQETILDMVMSNGDLHDSWLEKDLKLCFFVHRNKAGNGGVELRATVSAYKNGDEIPKEPKMPENELVKDFQIVPVHAVGEHEDFGGSDFPDIQTPADDTGRRPV